MYREGTITERNAQKWFSCLKKGNFDPKNFPHSEHQLNKLIHTSPVGNWPSRLGCSWDTITRHLLSMGKIQNPRGQVPWALNKKYQIPVFLIRCLLARSTSGNSLTQNYSLLHCRQQWKVEFQSIWSRGKDGRAVTCRQHLELSLCKKSDQHLVRLWTVNSPCGQSRALHSGSTRQSSWNDSAGDMACFFNMTMIATTPPPSLIWPKTKFKDLGSSTATTLLI